MCRHCIEICDATGNYGSYNYWNNLCHMLETASLIFRFYM